MHKSARGDWATPPNLFATLDAEFGFTLDAAATAVTAKCARFYTPEDDALSRPWNGERVFLNPPYGLNAMREWLPKARREADAGAVVVCLIPSRTDAGWWHDFVLGAADEIRYLRGRLRFVNPDTMQAGDSAPFGSALAIYRPPTGVAPLTPTEVHKPSHG